MLEIIYVLISVVFFSIAFFYQDKNQNKESLEKLGKEYLKHLLNNISSMQNESKEISTENHKDNDKGPEYLNKCTKTNYDSTIIPFFTIVYATQSGTAKKFADSLLNEAKENLQLRCILKNISEITSVKDFNENALIVFIVSTYGDGGPTDDSIEFNAMISDDSFWSSFNNPKLNYAIFGLGNSLYTKFNHQSKTINKIFSANKLNCICDIGIGDDSQLINEAFEEWNNNVFWPKTYDFFLKNKALYTAFNNKTQQPQINKQDLYEMTLSQSQTAEEIPIGLYEHSISKYYQSIKSRIESLVELRPNKTNGSTLKVTFSLNDSNQTYSVGGNIGIYPKNSEQSVNKIISHMNYNPNLIINYKLKSEEAKKQKLNLPIPVNMTIKEALVCVIDLSCQITKEFLSKISQYAGDEEQFNRLAQILNNKDEFEKFSAKRYNIIDVITEYDSIQIPFIAFCQLMSKIIPRFYSVASSPNKTKGKFDIAIALVEWKSCLDEKRYGLTSNYFNKLYSTNPNPLNEYTQIFIKNSAFKLPDDIHQPIIMIATGTGIAPFISFLQEMEYRNDPPYETCLIFGTKNKDCDYIYEKELNYYVQKKYLKQLHCAFSRDQNEKVYVQDVLLKQFNNKLGDLIQKNVKIYICGSLSMGNSVMEYLAKILDEAQVKQMNDAKMIIKELWENK